MGRRKKETNETYEERQERFDRNLALFEKEVNRREVTFDTNNYVAMANNMILHSASNLTLNEVKLLRFFIMQTKKDDKELYSFSVNVKTLAKTLEISEKNLTRDLDKMTTHIMKEVIYIGDGSKKKWKQFHWVDVCEYDSGVLSIKISDELKPFLVGLRGSFTRYRLAEIINLHSMYAIKIYEVLNGYMDDNNKPHADVATEISISLEELRRITDTTNKFERYSNFKAKVIDAALKEINEKSIYHVTATPYKNGKMIAGFDFLIESQAGYWHRTETNRNDIKIKAAEDDLDGQMNLMDYQTSDNKFEITKG